MTRLDPTQQRLIETYRKKARHYNVVSRLYPVPGYPQQTLRRRAVRELRLRPGATVVDLACGTGQNFPMIEAAIGPHGRIVGVDLTDAMLAQAHRRIEENGWRNVELVQADAADFAFPAAVDAILSTYALSHLPDCGDVIGNGAAALARDGRCVVLDLKAPDHAPRLLGRLGVALGRPFGSIEEWLARRPWEGIHAAMQEALGDLSWSELCLGTAYLAVGVPRAGRGRRRGSAALLGDQGDLAHAFGRQPIGPQPVGAQQLLQGPLPDLRGDVGGIGGERLGQRCGGRGMRLSAVFLPADDQADPVHSGEHLLDLDQMHGVGVGHQRPLRVGERRAPFKGAGESPAGGERGGDLPQQRLLLGERQHRLKQEHHLERAWRQRRDPRYLEATGEIAGPPARDLDGAGAVVDPEVVATQLPRDEAPRPGDAAAQVQHRDARADARLSRQRQDFAGAHEALLFDELAGRIRPDPGPPEGTHEGSALVLPHAEDASPPERLGGRAER
jgi:ubiquinone/menaquinone biosynthesis C-methylase UbiE